MKNKIGFACVFWLRVNQLFMSRNWKGQSRLYLWRQYRFANDISPYADIGPGLWIPHPNDIMIGACAKIGKNVTIYNGVTLVGLKEHPHLPCLEDNVIVYTGAKIIRPITVGEGSVIGALALCTHDIPAQSVMYGIPPNVTVKPKK